MGPCVVAQVPNQEPRRLRQWNGAAGGWFRITLVSFLASLPVEQLRAFPSSLSDCQTPTGWNCSGENLPHFPDAAHFHFCRVWTRVRGAHQSSEGALAHRLLQLCVRVRAVLASVLQPLGRRRWKQLRFVIHVSASDLGNASATRLPQRLIASLTQKLLEHLGLKTDSDGCSHVHRGSLFIYLSQRAENLVLNSVYVNCFGSVSAPRTGCSSGCCFHWLVGNCRSLIEQ